MFELFWELNQNRRIGEAQSEARNSESRARDLGYQVQVLKQSIEKLALVNAVAFGSPSPLR